MMEMGSLRLQQSQEFELNADSMEAFVSLFGLNDQNIALIEQECNVHISLHDNKLIISGEEDPVGDYGEGVRTVAENLKKTGHDRVTVSLWKDCRHEVLNELNRQEVIGQILSWI